MKTLKKRCGAKLRNGRKCNKSPMTNGRCRLHGGASLPAGPGHPTYKHGLYSKAMPTGLQEKYLDARFDPELEDLRSAMATIDAMLLLEFESMPAGGLTAIKQFRVLWGQFKNAKSQQEKVSLVDTIDQVLMDGVSILQSFDRVRSLIEDKRRLHDSHARNESYRNAHISLAQLKTILDFFVLSVQKHGSDDVANQVRRDLRKVMPEV